MSSKLVRVLAVDDECLNNELLMRAFRAARKDMRLVVAESAHDGLEHLKNEEFDVMLVDQSMPNMTGVEFLERAQPLYPKAICIMVTGYPELREVLDARDRGLVHHIVAKPWRAEELLNAIDIGLTLSDLRQLASRVNQGQET